MTLTLALAFFREARGWVLREVLFVRTTVVFGVFRGAGASVASLEDLVARCERGAFFGFGAPVFFEVGVCRKERLGECIGTGGAVSTARAGSN